VAQDIVLLVVAAHEYLQFTATEWVKGYFWRFSRSKHHGVQYCVLICASGWPEMLCVAPFE